jgi:hypothetical protein
MISAGEIFGILVEYAANSSDVAFAFCQCEGCPGADCSPAYLDAGPVGSTTQIGHSLLQADISSVPSCPRGFGL